MGRKSKLTDAQWAEIKRRLLANEVPADLAREYGVDRAQICRKFSKEIATIKDVTNQILEAERSLKQLPVAQQIEVTDLVNQLRSISSHLASAANYGAATAHRLTAIANAEVQKIDDTTPIAHLKSLSVISALTKIANDSADIGLNLLNANKELAKTTNNDKPKSRREFYETDS